MNATVTDEVSVVIIEDYKLTRIGLRSTLNDQCCRRGGRCGDGA